MNHRLRVIQIAFLVFGLAISGRLAYWQIIKAKQLQQAASLQQSSTLTISAPRGDIKSADGFPLATNIDRYLFYAIPRQLPKNPDFVESLVPLLPASSGASQTLFDLSRGDRSSWWYPLAHDLPVSTKLAIENLHLSGLGFEPEPGRTYPEGSSSAYLLGFVGKNDAGDPRGYFGLEGFYDRELSGRPGLLIQEKDAFNRPITIGEESRLSPQTGRSLITSIDRSVQFIISQHLSAGLQKYQASGGTVSVMDPATGQILGLTSLPGYDPSRFVDYSPELYKNPVVSDSYEPGSTFKTIVMAAALDAGVVTPDTVCDICTGPAVIGDQVVRSWNDHYYPQSTMTDVILHSDNVGMVFVSRRLGRSRLLDYLRRFGLGHPTGIDLEDESSPSLRADKDWYDIDLATASFGQGVAVTPLQMLRAVGAIANLGKLVTPRVVTQIISGNMIKTLPTTKTVQVISPTAAVQITQMMINGVNRGEVRYYKPLGFLIAGKTGTAQVPISGHYDPNKVIASFIGFAPADKPKFVMLVTLKDPHPSPWGSTTAAPLWFDIARDLFRYYGITPI